MTERITRMRRSWRSAAPMELLFTFLGGAAYALAAVSLLAVAFLLINFGNPDRGFPAGEGLLKTIKGYGVGMFTVAAVLFYFLGRWLFDSRIPEARRAIAARYEAVRIATELAGHPDFQTAGSWEWRERVAYDLAPELRDYAESDDWAERRFARQTIKQAWELYLNSADAV